MRKAWELAPTGKSKMRCMVKATLAALGLIWMSGGPVVAQTADAGLMEQGNTLYTTNCAICHGADGKATAASVFPALAGSSSLEDAEIIVTNIHQGVAIMPPFPWLTDEDIAALATYIRNSWGNSFGEVSASDVASIRADLEPSGDVQSVWDGVFTEAQAKQGQAVYNGACGLCHGRRLDGVPDDRDMNPAPPLARAKFLRSWDGQSLGALFSYTRWTMPKSNPGFVSEEDYAAIVAYMLETTGAPAGDTPLSADPLELGLIRIGPKP